MQAGARVDDKSAFGTFGTWRVGVTWHPAEVVRVWGAAGTGFKAPTFPQQFAHSAYEVGDSTIRPVRSSDAELGARLEFAGGRVSVGVTGFRQQFRQLIQYISAPPGSPTYTNLGGARARGVEATIDVTVGRGLDVSAHWSRLATAVTDTGAAASVGFSQGEPLLRRPGESGGVLVRYQQGGATLALVGTYVGARDDIDYSGLSARRVILPGYGTWDLSLTAPVRRRAGRAPGVDVTVRGENIFDAAYQQAVGFPGRRRTALVGVDVGY